MKISRPKLGKASFGTSVGRGVRFPARQGAQVVGQVKSGHTSLEIPAGGATPGFGGLRKSKKKMY